MALRTPLSVTPHLYMGDSTGRPLDKGVVYFGEQDKDPEFYPINLFSDDALTKPLAQPVHTKGGYLYDKGDMVEPHAKELIYSVKVLDSYGRKVFYKGAMMRNSWNDDVIEQINTAIIGSADIARQVATNITNDAINNTAVEGGVLADTFVTATIRMAGAVARTQRDKNSDVVSVKDFGAVGNGSQDIVSVTPYNTDQGRSVIIDKQTADGESINKAIRYLRSKGGGALHIPSGVYYTYGYLEPIDFPCVIYGDGENSLLKNCDNSPTGTNGYGILCIMPSNYEEVTLLNLKLDGNAEVRAKPTGEIRAYPLGVYGKPKLKMVGVTSINSPIDCFMTAYADNDPKTYCKAVNCDFSNSFRNTVSLVSGWGQDYVNCTFAKGGYVHGGTNPRYCLDIEPNLIGRSIEGINFTNCVFKEAVNVLVGAVWSSAQFSNCIFDGSVSHPSKAADGVFPWIFNLVEGQFALNNCKFIGRSDLMSNGSYHRNAYNTSSKFNDAQYLKFSNCDWLQCGFMSTSRKVELRNCTAQNSLQPFIVEGGEQTADTEVFIRGLKLTNVFDGANYGIGTYASFAIKSGVNGAVDIDDVVVEVDPTMLSKMDIRNFTSSRYMGVFLSASKAVSLGKKVRMRNIYSGGFYKKLPKYLGIPSNINTHRDWAQPSLPPADTIMIASEVTAELTDGTVSNGVVSNKKVSGTAVQTSSINSRTLGGRGLVFYKDCTMWGDFD